MLGITELTYTSLISFLIVVILGPIFIPMLTKFKFGQTVRDDGPKTHLAKNGTPTMGGILMIVAILITGLTRSKVGPDMVIGLICIFGFGLIGFIDDFIIIKKRRSLGLKPWQKIVMQFGLALYVANYQYTVSASAPQLMVPFTDIAINLGPLYVPIMIFVIVGTVNAVNLTDGLDGLASTVSVLVLTFFGVLTFLIKDYSLTIFSVALIAGLISIRNNINSIYILYVTCILFRCCKHRSCCISSGYYWCLFRILRI